MSHLFGRFLAVLLALSAGVSASAPAEAACTITGLQSITGTTANLGRYSSSTAPVAQVMTVNLVLKVATTGGTCLGSAALMSSTVPATMTGAGASTLRYEVQTLGGSSVLNTTLPNQTIPLSVATTGGQTTAAVSFQVQAVAVAGQVVAAGGYSDASVQTNVYDQSNATTPVAVASTWFVNAAANPSCTIDGRASANDATSVRVPVSSSGVVTTSPIVRSYGNILCNAPSYITMSSQRGGITNPAPAAGGFTNVIHYSAQAVFGGATATIDTATSTLTAGNISATTGASGSMSVTITPQQPSGATLITGRYDDVLSVTLTPQ